ncbi:hypothetical protein [Schlesneria paludicola]|uniref:hypothetical protein n=1 Tax=Schlesneria paludicola TaxID=360056 RepID=UPI00029ACC8A|nr:hypothetical protein [Schlesneria paludicola]
MIPLQVRRIAQQPRPSSGFTLLEVLLTSLLASVVLIALWSLSDIYMRLFVSGRNKIEETQLARSLTSQFARDVSQVVQRPEERRLNPSFTEFAPPFASPPGSRNAQPMRAALSGAAAGRQDPGLPPPSAGSLQGEFIETNSGLGETPRQIDESIPRFGLFGTSDALRLIVLQIDPRTTRAPTELADVLPDPGRLRTPFASELRTIEYSLGTSRESTDLDQRHPPGLIRREWAWEHWIGLRAASQLSVGAAEASAMLPKGESGWTAEDTVAFEDQEYLHVSQVQSLEFKYFDGEDWDVEWNSWERGKLPVLVEVLLEFEINSKPRKSAAEGESTELADETGSSSNGVNRAPGGTVYRRLIHLPFANNVNLEPELDGAPIARMSPPVSSSRTRQP